ncbi:amino acid ABC transporter permease [Gynuella sunshinyii]|nr:amino acid ABC transporter permease [Gynuella sunshinyii]
MTMKFKDKLQQAPWWLLVAFLLALILGWNILADQSYELIFNALSKGIWMTLKVTFIAFLSAVSLGLVIALAGFSSIRLIREVVRFYVEIIRGIPVLVLLFYVAFVVAPALVDGYNWLLQKPIELGWLDSARTRDFNMVWRAVFALTISYSAFIAEIFRAGIQEIDKGQIEAAQSLGLKDRYVFRFIIFPQAVRKVLPPLGNDFVAMIKDSALVSVLGVQDITQLGKVYSSSTFKFFETYNVVAFLYLILTISLSLMVRGLERHLRRFERH